MRLSRMFPRFGWLLLAVILLAGCATPIGVRQVSPRDSYRETMTNPLTEGRASNATHMVLHRFDLTEKYAKNPVGVIEALHDKALRDDRRDLLYALAELCYLNGDELEKNPERAAQALAPGYFLATATYAYFFLLDNRIDPPPNAFDVRVRTAVDLYNFALWRGLANGGDGGLNVAGGVRKLPVGALDLTVDASRFPWPLDDFARFEPTDKYVVRGVSFRDRIDGVGNTLVGVKRANRDTPFTQAMPITVFLRISGNLAEVTQGTAAASLEFFSAYDDNRLDVKGRHPPLETDTTTLSAYVLETSKVWDFGLEAFLGKEF